MRPEILFPLFAPVTSLKGVGPKIAAPLERLAGERVRDLVFLAPHGLVWRPLKRVAEIAAGETVRVELTIGAHNRPRRPGAPWRTRAFDETGSVTLLWFKSHGPHLERAHPAGARRVASGKAEADRYGDGLQFVHPEWLVAPERAGEIPEVEAVYPLTEGLGNRQVGRLAAEALARAPELPEWIDRALLERERWPGWRAALDRLHAPASEDDFDLQAPHRRRLAYDELLAHQLALGARKRQRRAAKGRVFEASPAAQRLRNALPFTLTGDQAQALAEIGVDLASGERMTRLLQGDVGSGKTVVAMLAMADVAAGGAQAALMAPTEILARQHFEAIAAPLAAQDVEAVLLTGRDKGAERRRKLALLAGGEAAVAVGTHALFQDDVAFASLALAVIDEQHRFGVGERGRLLAKGAEPHVLAMSATPIPRTLELTLYGDLDVSRIVEKPPGRTPVATRAAPTGRIGEVVARLAQAIAAGAQAYWICPVIEETESADLAAAEARVRALAATLGEAAVGLVHGRMAGPEKDAAMVAFAGGSLPVLVATTVVEVGMDVPAASIMVIEQAERFGLAQLHQLRGRVGRGAAASSCVLLYDPPLSETAGKRLDILRRTHDGFVIAEKDLELRGGGDPLGLKQSGFPRYRLADPIAHGGLIRVAADQARLMLARDPELARHEAAHVLTGLFDWRPEDGTSAG